MMHCLIMMEQLKSVTHSHGYSLSPAEWQTVVFPYHLPAEATSFAVKLRCSNRIVTFYCQTTATTDRYSPASYTHSISIISVRQQLRWRPFGHNRHGPKRGGCCTRFGGGELAPHL